MVTGATRERVNESEVSLAALVKSEAEVVFLGKFYVSFKSILQVGWAGALVVPVAVVWSCPQPGGAGVRERPRWQPHLGVRTLPESHLAHQRKGK